MVMAVSQFERLFREAASLDIDKNDIKRLEGFVNDRLHDLLLRAVANARANGRDIIAVQDVPITKGLQEQIHLFRSYDEELNLKTILDHLSRLPTLELDYDESVREKLPEIVGGITVGLARVFRTIYPKLKNPATQEWETVEAVYKILW